MTVHQKLEGTALAGTAVGGPAVGGHAEAKIVRVGNSLGLVLSKDMLAHLKVGQGDKLFVVESPDGLLLSPFDPAIADQVKRGQAFMLKYRDTFRALAK